MNVFKWLTHWKRSIFVVLVLPISVILVACGGSGILAGGPGTGGTGPVGAASGAAGAPVAAIQSSSTEHLVAMSAVKSTEFTPTSDVLPQPPKPEDTLGTAKTCTGSDCKTKVMVKSTSRMFTSCGGLSRNISLIQEGKTVDKVTLEGQAPIFIRATVQNTGETELTELRYDCTSFKVNGEATATNTVSSNTNNADVFSNTQTATCAKPVEKMVYQPKQVHTYSVKIDQPSAAGTYRVSYTNTVEGAKDTTSNCSNFIELVVER